MASDQVKLTLNLTDGRELSVTCDYMGAAERIVQAKKWPLFKDYKLEGPASELAELIVARRSAKA